MPSDLERENEVQTIIAMELAKFARETGKDGKWMRFSIDFKADNDSVTTGDASLSDTTASKDSMNMRRVIFARDH